jgi:hypothetical protein
MESKAKSAPLEDSDTPNAHRHPQSVNFKKVDGIQVGMHTETLNALADSSQCIDANQALCELAQWIGDVDRI